MKLIQKRIYLVIIAAFLTFYYVDAQQDKSKEAIKKKEKVEQSAERDYEKARKKILKHRHDIQSKETKEQMKSADKKAKKFNNQGYQGFLERLFKRKKYKK